MKFRSLGREWGRNYKLLCGVCGAYRDLSLHYDEGHGNTNTCLEICLFIIMTRGRSH